eukprot:gene13127-17699_t
MTVLRRLDAVLEPTKAAVLEMKAALGKEKITNQDGALRSASGEAFYILALEQETEGLLHEITKGVKYSIDYYQREYKWHEKQIRELVDDLSDKFLEEYQSTHPRSKVADYPHYFLGSIIISKKDSVGYIVDGQQRLTSLTLLLVLLRNLQRDHEKQVNVD